ncbi:disks large 1-like protein [Dermatophagoides farinae]|uniref:Disks large 1-like protein n=1 Tax=Dermatophagoides farinae TaxID=6954 RepID=A0A9D4NZM1_DERFA|nr:disks large homolog 1-like [Dermatophagoides farinae]KAH7640460.1 disks large 1-like protein [Dermatophagoides farinae]
MGNTINSSSLPYRSQTRQSQEMMIRNANFEWQYIDIYLDLSECGLGISIRGGIDSPNHAGFQDVYISRILGAGAVARDGRIQLGDVIAKVNGESLENVTHKEAVNIILNAGQYIHFHIKRRKFIDSSDIYEQIEEANEDDALLIGSDRQTNFEEILFDRQRIGKGYNDCIKVEMIRDINGFGFSLIGGLDNPTREGDPGIYVNNIVPDGPVHRTGQINIGDEIVAINDTNIECVPYKWALDVIRNSPTLSVFTIRKTINWD